MPTIKINMVCLMAVVVLIVGIVSTALLEEASPTRTHLEVVFESSVVVAVFVALVVILANFFGVNFLSKHGYLIFGASAMFMLIGVICVGFLVKKCEEHCDLIIPSAVFGIFTLFAAGFAAISPFIFKESD